MRQIIMFLAALIFGLAAMAIGFSGYEVKLYHQGIGFLFCIAFLTALWGVFHHCKCNCECGCKGKVLEFKKQEKEE